MGAQYLHFNTSVGRRLLEVEHIIEVIPMVALKREPEDVCSPKFCGVFNFRGSIIPAFDFAEFESANIEDPARFLVVTATENGTLALVASELDYLVDVQAEQVNHIVTAQNRGFEVVKINSEMIRVVDAGEFLDP